MTLVKQLKYFALCGLFVLLIAPAVSAQSIISTGTLIALIENEFVIIDISSGATYERLKYVNEQNFARNPNKFRNFRPTERMGRNDLRIVHQEVAKMQKMGWELLSSDHSLAASDANGDARTLTEKLVFHFRVPDSLQVDAPPVVAAEKLIVSDYDFGLPNQSTNGAKLYQNADSTYTFVVEQRINRSDKYRPIFTLHDQGIAGGDLPLFLSGLEVTRDRLRLKYEMANGNYEYEFRPSGTDYLLNIIIFSGEADCGVNDLRVNFQRFGRLQADVTYRPKDCTGKEEPRSVRLPISIDRIQLSEFTPLVNRLVLESIGHTVIY